MNIHRTIATTLIIAALILGLLVLPVGQVEAPPSNCEVNNVPSLGGGDKPQDLDGDCLYEDVNGDNSVDILDTQTLFSNLRTAKVQDNSPAFSFSNITADSTVSIFDVAAHWLFIHQRA